MKNHQYRDLHPCWLPNQPSAQTSWLSESKGFIGSCIAPKATTVFAGSSKDQLMGVSQACWICWTRPWLQSQHSAFPPATPRGFLGQSHLLELTEAFTFKLKLFSNLGSEISGLIDRKQGRKWSGEQEGAPSVCSVCCTRHYIHVLRWEQQAKLRGSTGWKTFVTSSSFPSMPLVSETSF